MPETNDKEPKFEDCQRKVEDAVRALESGQLDLEQSLAQYESGMTALKRCYEILDQLEKRIEVLVQQKDGSLAGRPFEPAAEAERPRRK